jgi:hypothetical protein
VLELELVITLKVTMDNATKGLIGFTTVLTASGGFILIPFFNWHNNLEFKKVRVPHVQIGSTDEKAQQNFGIGSASQDYASVVDPDDKNPETVKVSKELTPTLQKGTCFKVSIEGYKSFMHQRWIKSVEETGCP